MGGGGSKQSFESDVWTDIMSQVIGKYSQTCQYSVLSQQGVDINGNYNVVDGVKMRQAYELTASCFQNVQQITEMQNEIANNLSAQAAQVSQPLLGSIQAALGAQDEQNISMRLRTAVRNTVTNELLNEIKVHANMMQGINIDGSYNIVRHVDLNQLGDIVVQASQSAIQNTEMIQNLRAQIEQDGTQEEQNDVAAIVDSIGDAISGIIGAPAMYMMLGLLFIVLVAFALKKMFPDMSGALDAAGASAVGVTAANYGYSEPYVEEAYAEPLAYDSTEYSEPYAEDSSYTAQPPVEPTEYVDVTPPPIDDIVEKPTV